MSYSYATPSITKCVFLPIGNYKRKMLCCSGTIRQRHAQFQIMFRVGMGETPAIPERLSKEGQDFLALCFEHDPRARATA